MESKAEAVVCAPPDRSAHTGGPPGNGAGISPPSCCSKPFPLLCPEVDLDRSVVLGAAEQAEATRLERSSAWGRGCVRTVWECAAAAIGITQIGHHCLRGPGSHGAAGRGAVASFLAIGLAEILILNWRVKLVGVLDVVYPAMLSRT